MSRVIDLSGLPGRGLVGVFSWRAGSAELTQLDSAQWLHFTCLDPDIAYVDVRNDQSSGTLLCACPGLPYDAYGSVEFGDPGTEQNAVPILYGTHLHMPLRALPQLGAAKGCAPPELGRRAFSLWGSLAQPYSIIFGRMGA